MTDVATHAWLRTGLVLFLSLSACSPRAPAAADREKVATAPGQHCRERAKADLQAQIDRAKRDQAFYALASSGNGDPVAEARRAISAGDMRFLGYSMVIPGNAPAAFGVECRPDLRLLRSAPMRAMFSGSDVIGPREQMEAERREGENFGRFAAAYNATLLADPRYPYSDICRAAPPGYRPLMKPPTASTSAWGFRDLALTNRPIDLGEAARRGSLDSLKALLKTQPGAVNHADIFGMAPLAWAITYRRQDHIAALLAAGASAAGTECGNATDATTPIQIARSLRWRSLVTTLLPHLSKADRERLTDPPTPDPEARIDLNDLRKPVGQGAVTVMLDIDATGLTRGCTVIMSSGDARFDRQVCGALVKRRRWRPARDEYGDPIAWQRRDRISFR